MRADALPGMTMGELRRRYEGGENITQLLRAHEGFNEESAIEAAYDLRSGSYVHELLANRDRWERYTSELAQIAAPYIRPFDTILDCGTGELITLLGLSRRIPRECQLLAFDINLSRVVTGLDFLASYGADLAGRVRTFCAPMGAIPLPDKCVDVLMTAHALESNRGREAAPLGEFFRVCRSCAILFEPSYEHNSEDGHRRMDELGYVRDLDHHIAAAGGTMLARVRVDSAVNSLNPTYAWIIQVEGGEWPEAAARFVCPISRNPLIERDGFLWSPGGLYCYPVYKGIPILKVPQAIILTTASRA